MGFNLVSEKKVLYLERNGERVDLRHPDPGRLQGGWSCIGSCSRTTLCCSTASRRCTNRPACAARGRYRHGRKIWLPLQLTPGFNADFDGDEMNLHVPRTVEARAECLELLSATENTLKASDGKASVVPVQGDRLATYLMTSPDCFLTRAQWHTCVSSIDDGSATAQSMLRRARAHLPAQFPAHARRLWSLALPDEYNWSRKDVSIVCGVLQTGRVTKKVLLQLVHDITLDRSGAEALNFQHGVTRVCNTFNTRVNPSTVHFSEIAPSDALTDRCASVVQHMHASSWRPGADPHACMTKRRK